MRFQVKADEEDQGPRPGVPRLNRWGFEEGPARMQKAAASEGGRGPGKARVRKCFQETIIDYIYCDFRANKRRTKN